MDNLILFILIFAIGESISIVIFRFLQFQSKQTDKFKLGIDFQVVKGILERLFLFLALLYGIPQALIAFGAIKIGTRFKPDDKIQNDYFFLGNITSLLIVLFYFIIWNSLQN